METRGTSKPYRATQNSSHFVLDTKGLRNLMLLARSPSARLAVSKFSLFPSPYTLSEAAVQSLITIQASRNTMQKFEKSFTAEARVVLTQVLMIATILHLRFCNIFVYLVCHDSSMCASRYVRRHRLPEVRRNCAG